MLTIGCILAFVYLLSRILIHRIWSPFIWKMNILDLKIQLTFLPHKIERLRSWFFGG